MRTPKVHIIGGGFSGLMAAYFCRRRGFEVAISEGRHWGGLIGTEKTEWGTVEKAANGFLLTSLLEDVARDLEIPLLAPRRESRKRWIANEKPQRLPVSPFTLVGTGLRFWNQKRAGNHAPRPQELLSDWGDRVLGHEFQNRVVLPAVQGIYGADSRCLSARLALKPFFEKGRAKRRGLVSPLNGMGQWTDQLLARLRSQNVELREERIERIPDADHVILACGSLTKAELLKDSAPATARALAAIERFPVASVTAFFPHHASDYRGFGILFHPDRGWAASGVLFNDRIFENRSAHRSETWIFPRAKSQDLSEKQWSDLLRSERRRIGMADQEPLGVRVSRWPQALPLYSPALENWLAGGLSIPNGVSLLGHEMGEIGLTGLAENASRAVNSLWHEGLSA